MSRIAYGLAGTALGLFGLTATAMAQVPGYTLPEANLRAGPGRDYPLISLVPPGQPAQIFGCVGGYGWCDVEVDGMRGFISGRKLQVIYRDRRVGLSYYGPRLELPVIQFDIGTYWGQYYPSRPFYAERYRWQHGPENGHGYPHPGPGINDYNHPGPPAHPPIGDEHGYPHPAPGPDHGINDYNHPGPPAHQQMENDHERSGAAPPDRSAHLSTRPDEHHLSQPPAAQHPAPGPTIPEPEHQRPEPAHSQPSSAPSPTDSHPHHQPHDLPPGSAPPPQG